MGTSLRTVWSTISWTSSNTNVISIQKPSIDSSLYAATGVINQPVEDTEVTLTATFTANESVMNEQVEKISDINTISVPFTVTVKGTGKPAPTEAELKAILNQYYKITDLVYYGTTTVIDPEACTGDIQLPRYTRIKDENGENVFNNKEITVTSDNDAVKINGYKANVDVFQTQDTTVNLTVSFTREGVTVSRVFPITIKKLTQEEIRKEVIALQDMGHKRLALETGEDPVNNPIEYVLESIQTIYSIKHKNGAIRRVNVNIAATTVENYRKLKEAGIGTYILFQETYHKESYEKLHPTGPKHDYAYHTEAMDRAMEGGIDDVGLGVLFGLDLYRYEFAGLLMHAEHLEAVHGVGPHTISVPRIKHADDIDPSAFDNGISDDTFAKICALIRVSVPYTGMIISTRESQEVRNKVLPLGVSQISGASKTSVGGYAEPEKEGEVTSEQFDVSDQRTLDEVVNWLIKLGYIPSFCTACYREGRTGDRFMALCKNMQILNCCHPNALMTLKEYLEDYASEETKRLGMELIDRELEKIPNPKVKQTAYEHIHDIAEGKRDFRF